MKDYRELNRAEKIEFHRKNIKTVGQLRDYISDTGSKYFNYATMRFFGDTMRNYKFCFNAELDAFVLIRRKPVKGGLSRNSYFDAETFKHLKVYDNSI